MGDRLKDIRTVDLDVNPPTARDVSGIFIHDARKILKRVADAEGESEADRHSSHFNLLLSLFSNLSSVLRSQSTSSHRVCRDTESLWRCHCFR
ncbi:hypothetical protein LR48_Vigan09g022200 [Vigna angularis]|uniref:Uncharacterized protein n=1 Tax=Phaseolus angularis TaxID=3914 RepID=A0A0L9V993_PHAAN|nr:hypothetical protein LR48_Vigan09g022200 [Vigna angularis]